jgi:hypothetical protein
MPIAMLAPIFSGTPLSKISVETLTASTKGDPPIPVSRIAIVSLDLEFMETSGQAAKNTACGFRQCARVDALPCCFLHLHSHDTKQFKNAVFALR